MADLNETYGTVTDGGSTDWTFSNPSYANDGTILYASYVGGVWGAGTHYIRLKTDLGTARAVSGMTLRYQSQHYFTKLEHSTDGASWTDTAIVPTTPYLDTYLGEPRYIQQWLFPANLTYRYWRLTYTRVTTGLRFDSGIQLDAWEIDAGTPPRAGVWADWDGDGFGTGAADNITSHVASWRITRGASPEITGGAQPGSCTLTLNNPADDRYNPLNAGGPLYGLLRDGVPLWIGVTADGLVSGNSAYGLFGGRVTDITPVPQGGLGRAAKVELNAEDALARLARTDVTLVDGLDRTQGEIREAILAAAGESSWNLQTESAVVPVSAWNGVALGALDDLNKANGTRHFVKPGATWDQWYVYVARNRSWRIDGSSDAAVDAGSDHVTGTNGWRLSADTVINRQKVTVTPIRFTTRASVIWQAPNLPFKVKTGRPVTIWVEFDDFVSVASLDTAVSGSSLTATFTNFGTTGKIVLTSSGTTTVSGLEIEGRMVRRGNPISAVADDATSQAGPRGVRAGSELSSAFTGSLAAAQGLADHIVWRYGNPQFRPTMTVMNLIPEQFAVDLYDVLEVTVGELAMTSRLFEVVGLTHECDLAASTDAMLHTTTYVLQECRVQAGTDWFTLGSSLLDSSDVLGY